MQDKVKIRILTILVALLCTDPVLAAQKTQLDIYIGRQFYKEKVLRAATTYALAHSEGCAVRNALASRVEYHVIEPVAFVAEKLHPIRGSWFETISLVQCQKSYRLDITVMSNDGKMPDFIATPSRIDKASSAGASDITEPKDNKPLAKTLNEQQANPPPKHLNMPLNNQLGIPLSNLLAKPLLKPRAP